ncbi:hypothetical protein EIO00_12575 [Thermomonospora catenispora]|nr:hypothetical protein EIO00_12575 [Thermomonospora catenispora]
MLDHDDRIGPIPDGHAKQRSAVPISPAIWTQRDFVQKSECTGRCGSKGVDHLPQGSVTITADADGTEFWRITKGFDDGPREQAVVR